MVFLGCLQLYMIFVALFFFSFSLVSIYSIVEHEEKVPVKLKTIMDYPMDRAACLFPRFQWSLSTCSQCHFFSLSFSSHFYFRKLLFFFIISKIDPILSQFRSSNALQQTRSAVYCLTYLSHSLNSNFCLCLRRQKNLLA